MHTCICGITKGASFVNLGMNECMYGCVCLWKQRAWLCQACWWTCLGASSLGLFFHCKD